MIYIDGHWESVYGLPDISRIIREYYNPELANELDELIEEIEDNIEYLIGEINWYTSGETI